MHVRCNMPSIGSKPRDERVGERYRSKPCVDWCRGRSSNPQLRISLYELQIKMDLTPPEAFNPRCGAIRGNI